MGYEHMDCLLFELLDSKWWLNCECWQKQRGYLNNHFSFTFPILILILDWLDPHTEHFIGCTDTQKYGRIGNKHIFFSIIQIRMHSKEYHLIVIIFKIRTIIKSWQRWKKEHRTHGCEGNRLLHTCAINPLFDCLDIIKRMKCVASMFTMY